MKPTKYCLKEGRGSREGEMEIYGGMNLFKEHCMYVCMYGIITTKLLCISNVCYSKLKIIKNISLIFIEIWCIVSIH
jgi:hypothetical protein